MTAAPSLSRAQLIALSLVTCASLLVSASCRGGDEPTSKPAAKPSAAPVEPPVRSGTAAYTLGFEDAANHYLSALAVVPVSGSETTLMMANWAPGSYKIRDFARHIEGLTAHTRAGAPLTATKIASNRWRVEHAGQGHIVLRYRVYSRQLTVRTNYVDAEVAVLHGAATFLVPAERDGLAFDVKVAVTESLRGVVTGMTPHPDGGDNRFLAADYDTLVDCPIVVGQHELYRFEVDGVPYRLANFSEENLWDGKRSAQDVEKIVRAQTKFWGQTPMSDYVFINVLLGRSGGLEHKSSTVMIVPRTLTRNPDRYRGWLGLVSHEFFHTWNVKRLRPVTLGPFDYERMVHTESLWIAEGITSYYDDLLVARADLMSEAHYLEALAKQLEVVAKRPGRKVQSLSASSFDSWTKYYITDENTRNTTVNYYRRGAAVGFLLDVAIRRATANRRSLDDAMRLAYERYSGETGYTPDQFRAVLEEVAGVSFADFYAKYIDGTEELDFAPALAYFGLRRKPTADPSEAPGANGDAPPDPGHLGAVVEDKGGRLVVSEVPRETPAYAAGINVGDELLAISGERISQSGLEQALADHRPGDDIELLLTRHGRIRTLTVTLGKAPDHTFAIEPDPAATAATTARRQRWIRGK